MCGSIIPLKSKLIMMKTSLRTLLVLLVLAASLPGCMDRTVERITYKANVPVYMSFREFRGSFSKSEAIEISSPGKIYFKDNYLLLMRWAKEYMS
jgi:hypothetical protein